MERDRRQVECRCAVRWRDVGQHITWSGHHHLVELVSSGLLPIGKTDSLRTWSEKTPSSALEGAPELNFRAFPADPPTAWACLQSPMLSDEIWQLQYKTDSWGYPFSLHYFFFRLNYTKFCWISPHNYICRSFLLRLSKGNWLWLRRLNWNWNLPAPPPPPLSNCMCAKGSF